MDYADALFAGVVVSALLLAGSLLLFFRGFLRIRTKVSAATRRGLIFFGAACATVPMIVVTLVLSPPDSTRYRAWLGLFYAMLILAQLQILETSDIRRRVTAAGVLILGGIATASAFVPSDLTNTMLIATTASLYIISLLLAIRIVIAAPSPFSVSTLVLTNLVMIAAATRSLRVLETSPHYFPLVFMPAVVSAAVLVSMLRPWRYIISLSVSFFAMINMTMLCYGSLMSMQYPVFAYALVAGLASICLMVPLGYFLDQASITRARTPVFLSLTLILVSLLASTHSVDFSYAFIGGDWMEVLDFVQPWDLGLLFTDWVIGVLAISCFTLASLSSTLSDKSISRAVDFFVVADSVFITLGHPYVRADMAGVERWELQPLYIPVAILMILAIAMFIRVSLSMRRTGSRAAASRFFRFVMAAVAIGIVAMFSDSIPFFVVLTLMSAATILLLGSNPAGMKRMRLLKRSSKEV
ncbi:MAG: hypothetical protein HXY34_00610 [Candidatus Thorarchaeota archaeon]|nr:hypothetical protein [Candidatus Thorarchaeota archaeon]